MPHKTQHPSLPKTFILTDLSQWKTVADFVHSLQRTVVTLSGNLGAGKTAFTNYLVKVIGSHDKVTSPTFSIVNTYKTPSKTIYHMDLYRLESYEELFNAGIEEYFYAPDALCIVEWPDLILDTDLVDDATHISIQVEDGIRTVVIQ